MGILNGNVICDSNTNSLGTSCKYQCDEGFKLVGTDVSICSLNQDELGAFWSQNPPFCEGEYRIKYPVSDFELSLLWNFTGVNSWIV